MEDTNEHEIKIIIGGDLVPVGQGVKYFESGDVEELIGADLFDIIHSADFSVFNLEVPLTDIVAPIQKNGPNLIAPTKSIVGLSSINPGAFALANNHILDQGAAGLFSTLGALNSVGAVHFGAGETLEQAFKPYVFEKNGLKIGFYACTEHEFSIASDTEPGANPFDPLESLDHIATLKNACDYVIVLHHGGKEHYRYPSPLLQQTCRKMADKGADLVVCQHSHCIGCEEKWAGSTIIYGQGNFLFDHSVSEYWQTSLLLELIFDNNGFCVNYLPLQKQGIGVRLAKDYEAQNILECFFRRSDEILDHVFVKSQYAALADEMIANYLGAFVPGSRSIVFRVLNKLSGRKLLRMLSSTKRALSEENYLSCEAHRELFIEGLRRLQ